MILLIRKIDLSGSFNIMGDRYTYNLNVASISNYAFVNNFQFASCMQDNVFI